MTLTQQIILNFEAVERSHFYTADLLLNNLFLEYLGFFNTRYHASSMNYIFLSLL